MKGVNTRETQRDEIPGDGPIERTVGAVPIIYDTHACAAAYMVDS